MVFKNFRIFEISNLEARFVHQPSSRGPSKSGEARESLWKAVDHFTREIIQWTNPNSKMGTPHLILHYLNTQGDDVLSYYWNGPLDRSIYLLIRRFTPSPIPNWDLLVSFISYIETTHVAYYHIS